MYSCSPLYFVCANELVTRKKIDARSNSFIEEVSLVGRVNFSQTKICVGLSIDQLSATSFLIAFA